MTDPSSPPPAPPVEWPILLGVAFAVTAMLCLTAILLGHGDALARWGPLALVPLPVVGWCAWREVRRGE